MAKVGRPTNKSVAMKSVWARKSKRERKAWADAISKGQKKRYRRERRAA